MAARKDLSNNRSPEQWAEMQRREQVVIQARLRGTGWAEIKREHPEIKRPDRVFQRAVRRPENEPYARAEARRLEALRLDALQDGVWDKAMGGDARATEVALKILERRARMHGLDFADEIGGRLVEVEEAKVRAMSAALVTALQSADLPREVQSAVAATFFHALRAEQSVEGRRELS